MNSNIENDIEIIKNFIETVGEEYDVTQEKAAFTRIFTNYKRLQEEFKQEENEELNTRLQETINEKCELKTELYLNSIPKSKIKDKIGTYRRVISDSNDGDLIHDLRNRIHILEEVLENDKK